MERDDGAGPATCAAWIRRSSEKRVLVVMGRERSRSSPPVLDIFEFDAKIACLSPDPLVILSLPSVKPSGLCRWRLKLMGFTGEAGDERGGGGRSARVCGASERR